jgi:hypothetical protein
MIAQMSQVEKTTQFLRARAGEQREANEKPKNGLTESAHIGQVRGSEKAGRE